MTVNYKEFDAAMIAVIRAQLERWYPALPDIIDDLIAQGASAEDIVKRWNSYLPTWETKHHVKKYAEFVANNQ